LNSDAETYHRETLVTRLARLLEECREHHEVLDALLKYGTGDDELDLLCSMDVARKRELFIHAVEATYKDCTEAGCGDEVLSLATDFWAWREEEWLQESLEYEREQAIG
jgi:hypothetical protein